MRTITRLGALSVLLATVLTGWWLRSAGAGSAVGVGPNVEVSTATPKQLELASWAVERFEAVGLEPPVVEIAFHDDRSGCHGHLGFARSGRVDVCTVLVNAMTRRTILHEMSHIWLDQNVDGATRLRFLALRNLPSWNSADDRWEFRGCEHGAEILAWAIGERILTPQVPGNDPRSIAEAFELLTGIPLPSLVV